MRANQKKYNRKMWIIAALSLCVYAVFFMIILLTSELYFNKDITNRSDKFIGIAARDIVNNKPYDIFQLQKKYPEISVVYIDKEGEVMRAPGNYYAVITDLGDLEKVDDLQTNYLAKARYRTIVKGMVYQGEAVRVKIYYNLEDSYRVHDQVLVFITIILSITLMIVCVISLIISRLIARPYFELANKNNQLIYDTAHEFNTPLAVINTQLDNVSQNAVFPSELEDDIDIAKQEIKRLKRMTKDLLKLAKVENDMLQLSLEQCDIRQLVDEMVEPYQMLAESQDKVLTATLSDITANTDADKLRQIVHILLDNALKYTAEGESIDVVLKAERDKVMLTVRDTGIGVPVSELERIFEKFYRVDDSRTKSTGGTGIGLALLKALVYQFDGRLVASVNRPKGLRIDVILPQSPSVKAMLRNKSDKKVVRVVEYMEQSLEVDDEK